VSSSRRTETLIYGVGNFGIGVCDYTLQFVVFALYGHVLGLSSETITALLIATWWMTAVLCPIAGISWDAQANPGLTYRRRLWIAAALMSVGHFFVLNPPSLQERPALLAWLAVTLVLARIGMTLFRIPYLASGAALSSDYHERTRIAGVRVAFYALGYVSAVIATHAALLSGSQDQPIGMLNVDGYRALGLGGAVLIACVTVLHTSISYAAETPLATRSDPGVDWRRAIRDIRLAMPLKPLGALLACALLLSLIQGMSNGIWELAQDDLFVAGKFVVAALPALSGLLVGGLVWSRLRVDRNAVYLIGACVFAVFLLLPIMTRLLHAPAATEGGINGAVSLSSPLVAWIFRAACLIALEAMVADLSDVYRLRTGRASAGTLFGLAVALQSVGESAGRWLDKRALAFGFSALASSADETDPWMTMRQSTVAVPIALLAVLSAFVLARSQLPDMISYQNVRSLLSRRVRRTMRAADE